MKINTFELKVVSGKRSGFSLMEILVVLAIMALISGVSLASFVSYRQSQSLKKDRDVLVETLREARGKTISSKNGMVYGVHLASTTITLFPGGTYSSSTTSNQVIDLSSDTTLTSDLPNGVSSIIFKRLTGEITHAGAVTITLTSRTLATTSVKIYKTGTIELNP